MFSLRFKVLKMQLLFHDRSEIKIQHLIYTALAFLVFSVLKKVLR